MNKLQLSTAALFIGAALFSTTPAMAADTAPEATAAAPEASPAMKCVDKNNNDVMKDGKVITDESADSKEACTKADGHFVAGTPSDSTKPADSSTTPPPAAE